MCSRIWLMKWNRWLKIPQRVALQNFMTFLPCLVRPITKHTHRFLPPRLLRIIVKVRGILGLCERLFLGFVIVVLGIFIFMVYIHSFIFYVYCIIFGLKAKFDELIYSLSLLVVQAKMFPLQHFIFF